MLKKHSPVSLSSLPDKAACVDEFVIRVIDGAQPFQLKPYRLSFKEKRALDTEIAKLLQLGIIYPLPKPDYLSPVVLVRKSDNSLRMCIDFRSLNKQTVQSKQLLPNVEDVIPLLSGKSYFSSLDLRSGFWQVPIAKESTKYLGFSTHQGNFGWNRLPFGLMNATNHFQACMQKALAACRDYCLVYVDDIIIFSNSYEEHLTHLDKVLSCLEIAKLSIKIEKCKFAVG